MWHGRGVAAAAALLGLLALLGLSGGHGSSFFKKETSALWSASGGKCSGTLEVSNLGEFSLISASVNKPGDPASRDIVGDGLSVTLGMKSRAYFGNACTEGAFDQSEYMKENFMNKRVSYTVDLSGVGCGCNAALYMVSMKESEAAGDCDDDYYCDAMSVCGLKCAEIDLMEANHRAFHTTLHNGITAWDPKAEVVKVPVPSAPGRADLLSPRARSRCSPDSSTPVHGSKTPRTPSMMPKFRGKSLSPPFRSGSGVRSPTPVTARSPTPTSGPPGTRSASEGPPSAGEDAVSQARRCLREIEKQHGFKSKQAMNACTELALQLEDWPGFPPLPGLASANPKHPRASACSLCRCSRGALPSTQTTQRSNALVPISLADAKAPQTWVTDTHASTSLGQET
eukprot:g29784.t1